MPIDLACCTCAVHKINNMKGSIYMVFDYMDHDLTGLMERMHFKMDVPTVRLSRLHLRSLRVPN